MLMRALRNGCRVVRYLLFQLTVTPSLLGFFSLLPHMSKNITQLWGLRQSYCFKRRTNNLLTALVVVIPLRVWLGLQPCILGHMVLCIESDACDCNSLWSFGANPELMEKESSVLSVWHGGLQVVRWKCVRKSIAGSFGSSNYSVLEMGARDLMDLKWPERAIRWYL